MGFAVIKLTTSIATNCRDMAVIRAVAAIATSYREAMAERLDAMGLTIAVVKCNELPKIVFTKIQS